MQQAPAAPGGSRRIGALECLELAVVGVVGVESTDVASMFVCLVACSFPVCVFFAALSVTVTSGTVTHSTPPLAAVQAQSARLIGEAMKQNPAFLTLRKIEVGGETQTHRCFCLLPHSPVVAKKRTPPASAASCLRGQSPWDVPQGWLTLRPFTFTCSASRACAAPY